jgi:hypothetical protein
MKDIFGGFEFVGRSYIGMASAECHSVTSFNTIDVQVSRVLSCFVLVFMFFRLCFKVGGSRWDCLSRLTIYVE